MKKITLKGIESFLYNACLKTLIQGDTLPDVLYQYTDVNALKGIVDNNEIWATHWRYLNDKNEFTNGIDLITKHCDLLLMKNTNPTIGNYFLQLKNDLKRQNGIINYFDIGISSFTTLEDKLSQWRGYGKGYKSAAIGFDPEKILCDRNSKKFGYIVFCKVLYDTEEKEKQIKAFFGAFIGILSNPDSKFLNKYKKDIYTYFNIYVCILLLCFKEECWHEEGEWRLFTIPTRKEKFFFKDGSVGLIPFQKLHCFEKNKAIDAIKKIYLPKGESYELRRKALEMYNSKLKDKLIESSISIVYDERK